MLMTQLLLNIEDVSILPVLKKFIGSLKGVSISKVDSTTEKSSWLDEIGEGWKDDRTTDQIIKDIKETRTVNKDIEL